jgi:hypothetical protein
MRLTPEQLDALVAEHRKPSGQEILWRVAKAMLLAVDVIVILWFAMLVFIVMSLRI